MTRPKGYLTAADWAPRPKDITLINQVIGVINAATYRVSVRFIFYRLVGNHGYPKTEKAYKNLCNLLVKARRAQLIRFSSITDSDPYMAGGAWGYGSRSEFLNDLALVDAFDLNPLPTQPYRIEIWSEDAGSVPMIAGMTSGYPARIYSTGGFSSVTVTHAIAKRVMTRDVPTIFLHVGDFDPSGESIFTSMSQDVGAFISQELGCSWDPDTGETFNCEDEGLDLRGPEDSGIDFRPVRVALTREQTIEWDLETAPPKSTDSRSANWIGETVQIQAMSEDQLEEALREALDEYTDHDAIAERKDEADVLRDEMEPLVKAAIEGVIEELGDEE